MYLFRAVAVLYAMAHAFNNDYDLYNVQCNDNAPCMLNCMFQIMFHKCFIPSPLCLDPFFFAIDLILQQA